MSPHPPHSWTSNLLYTGTSIVVAWVCSDPQSVSVCRSAAVLAVFPTLFVYVHVVWWKLCHVSACPSPTQQECKPGMSPALWEASLHEEKSLFWGLFRDGLSCNTTNKIKHVQRFSFQFGKILLTTDLSCPPSPGSGCSPSTSPGVLVQLVQKVFLGDEAAIEVTGALAECVCRL